jgi:hypothetical protein
VYLGEEERLVREEGKTGREDEPLVSRTRVKVNRLIWNKKETSSLLGMEGSKSLEGMEH